MYEKGIDIVRCNKCAKLKIGTKKNPITPLWELLDSTIYEQYIIITAYRQLIGE